MQCEEQNKLASLFKTHQEPAAGRGSSDATTKLTGAAAAPSSGFTFGFQPDTKPATDSDNRQSDGGGKPAGSQGFSFGFKL